MKQIPEHREILTMRLSSIANMWPLQMSKTEKCFR